MSYSQHPLSAAFPSMSDEDFQALVDDIDNNGQREPVMIFEGMILDGWHRYRACTSLGMEVTKFEFKGDDPVSFVMSSNLHRRHLTASQRAAAVVACTQWRPVGKAKPETISGLQTEKEMARVAGTSDRTIRDAKMAHKAGLTDVVKSGAMTANEAAKVARGTIEKASKPAITVEVKQAPADDEGAPDQAEFDSLAAAEKAEMAAMRLLLASDEPLADVTAKYQQALLQIEQLSARIVGLQNQSTHQIKTIKSLQAKLKKLEQAA